MSETNSTTNEENQEAIANLPTQDYVSNLPRQDYSSNKFSISNQSTPKYTPILTSDDFNSDTLSNSNIADTNFDCANKVGVGTEADTMENDDLSLHFVKKFGFKLLR